MDLIKVKLPSNIELEGKFYKINTDFRAWLIFSKLLEKGARLQEFEYIYLDDIPKNEAAAFEKLLEFYNPPRILPRATPGASNNEKIIDYELDAPYIYAAFVELYGIDLLATDKTGHAVTLHWHKFSALLSSIHNTKLNEIMRYRAYDPNNRNDYNKQMQALKEEWRIPTKDDEKAKQQREEFNALFK